MAVMTVLGVVVGRIIGAAASKQRATENEQDKLPFREPASSGWRWDSD
jgi:hypothetical protein